MGRRLSPGALIVFQGSATDMEDGTLPDEALAWSSDRQGVLGTGPSLPMNTLQPGRHVITLTATDSKGHASVPTIGVYIGSRTYLPVIMDRVGQRGSVGARAHNRLNVAQDDRRRSAICDLFVASAGVSFTRAASSNSRTIAGLPLPLVSRITWPISQPKTFSSPPR